MTDRQTEAGVSLYTKKTGTMYQVTINMYTVIYNICTPYNISIYEYMNVSPEQNRLLSVCSQSPVGLHPVS